MTTTKSVYQSLKAVDVSRLVEQIPGRGGGLNYLNWADAVDQLLQQYPAATWEIHEWDGLPARIVEQGGMVKVTVTVEDLARTVWLPIMDNRHNAVSSDKITTRHINDSIQRCFVKACAMHGLGIDVFRGEEFNAVEPRTEAPEPQIEPTRKSQPTPTQIKELNRLYELAMERDLDQVVAGLGDALDNPTLTEAKAAQYIERARDRLGVESSVSNIQDDYIPELS